MRCGGRAASGPPLSARVSEQMNNTPERAEFWKEFICTKCQFPAPDKLRAQLSCARFSEFCNCGCNSFKVHLSEGAEVPPLAQPGRYGAVFEADFHLDDEGKTLEIILFAGKNGNLEYVEIDCCGNSFPVPDAINVKEPPFHVHKSNALVL
jgi:hypothetical protein